MDEYKHPEQLEDEVFYGNVDNGEDGFEDPRPGFLFKDLVFKTKRLGKTAYDTTGKPIFGSSPVFVKKEERERWDKNYEKQMSSK